MGVPGEKGKIPMKVWKNDNDNAIRKIINNT